MVVRDSSQTEDDPALVLFDDLQAIAKRNQTQYNQAEDYIQPEHRDRLL